MNIARGEMVERELDAMIERRSRKGEVERDELDPGYMQSVRRYNARRCEEMNLEWCRYHEGQAGRLRTVLEALIATHEEQAQKYLEKGN